MYFLAHKILLAEFSFFKISVTCEYMCSVLLCRGFVVLGGGTLPSVHPEKNISTELIHVMGFSY